MIILVWLFVWWCVIALSQGLLVLLTVERGVLALALLCSFIIEYLDVCSAKDAETIILKPHS
jgi:hypothetical protein